MQNIRYFWYFWRVLGVLLRQPLSDGGHVVASLVGARISHRISQYRQVNTIALMSSGLARMVIGRSS